MARLAREFSWHLFAFILVIAGLGGLAPLAWWQSRASIESVELPAAQQPQVAPLRPLVADDIRLDPSVTETPALPAGPSPAHNQQLLAEPSNELRLSATTAKTVTPQVPSALDVRPLEPSPLESQPLREPPQDPPSEPPPGALIATKAWPLPQGLIEQLNDLAAATPQATQWRQQVIAEIERLIAVDSLADPAAEAPLARLRQLADEAKPLAASLPEDDGRAKLLRAGYAIVRRLVIWDAAHTLSASGAGSEAPIVDRQAWSEALGKADEVLHATGAAANWRKYLLIDRAQESFDSPACTPADQRQLAHDILHRMHSTQLSHDQEQFLKTPPFAALCEQLVARAAQTPDLTGLLIAVEKYERDDRSAHARELAADYEAFRWSPEPAIQELADTVNSYYRNANVRIALSADLINKMVPQRQPQLESVQDSILGAYVEGQSHTNTQLKVVLVPDPNRWNIGLEAVGEVATDTASSKGPATFFQNGWSMFRARKRVTVDRRGIRLFSAEAEANANNQMYDFATDFDGMPLLHGLVRSLAKSQYDTSQPAAKVEVEGRIIVRATSQLDREVAQKLEQAKRDFQTKLLDPLRKLNLEPTAVDLETTTERLIARYRLAARHQVSAHTPRPQAPGDSVLSVQLHESALNNVLEELQLEGRRIEIRELFREMTTRFSQQKIEIPEDLPEDVYVTFANEDAVRVNCQDGLVRLTIRIHELVQQGTRNRWTDFTVRGYYGPSADQLDANLKREGIIELIGERRQLPLGQQLALRAIFSKVLSANRNLSIVNKQIALAPELKGNQVTQFVIHDGWMGIALGPASPGRQAAMRPKPPLRTEPE